MKKIYLVFTQTSSNLSRAIKLFTRAEFNHISVSLCEDLEPMWSFGRRRPYNPFLGGFVKEYPREGTFLRFPKTRCAVYSLSVTQEQFDALGKYLEEMYLDKDSYGYNFFGLCLAALKIPYTPKNHFYCSEFFKSVFLTLNIEGAKTLPKITEPCHFLSLPGISPVYRGFLREYRADHLRESQGFPT